MGYCVFMQYRNWQERLQHYRVRANNLHQRYGLPDRFPDAGSAEFRKFVDTEGVLYYREMQECGVPFPPMERMLNVGGETDIRVFLAVGSQCYDAISPWMPQSGRVLDFGVGCARTARFLYQDSDRLEVHGCDVDIPSIEYVNREAGFICAATTNNDPPLPYPEQHFDFIYCISVFTHFCRPSMISWLLEMRRILKPGARFALTVHGLTAVAQTDASADLRKRVNISEDEYKANRQRYETEGFFFIAQPTLSNEIDESRFGINFTNREWFSCWTGAAGFSLIDYQPGAISGWQDMAVIERTAG